MTAPVSKVEFLIAGVQKGGTTALFDYLRDHPQLNLAPEKEVHFFDDEAQNWSAPDYDAFHARFAPAGPGRISGEATPIYIYWPDSLERIRAYNPEMKLILLFRDPIARAWSQWRMEHARGAESEPFAWCIREGRDRLADSEKPGFHRVYSYVERGFYAAQLRRILELFPREQILILRSADLDQHPAEVLGQVFEFLGVSPQKNVSPRRVHVTAPPPAGERITQADVTHLKAVFADDVREFRNLTGKSLPGEINVT